MKIGDFFVQLGVKADTFTVRDFSKAIGDIPFSVAGAITSMTGLSLGFMELTHNTLDMANNLTLFKSETGLSMIELQKWVGVAKQVGISGDAVQSSIMGITQALAALRTGHADSGFMLAMGQMGVSVRGKNAFQILQDVMTASQRMSPSVAVDLLSRAHISPEMMKIFGVGQGKFNQMASRGVVMSDRDIAAMREFQQAIGQLTLTIEKSFVPVIREFEPYLSDIAKALGFIIAKAGGFFGKGIGEDARLFNAMRDQGGMGKFLENLFMQGLTPEELRAGTFNIEHNVTQNIHSTADAAEVARMATEHHKREVTKATKQFNNGGY